jgi:UDPglucose 6-dehydrogenase
MRIGFIGTGKLGLPVSLIYATKGHELRCYDINSNFYDNNIPLYNNIFYEELCPELKTPLKEWLPNRETLNYKHTTIDDIVRNSDLIFVAIQTPHDIMYEGVNRLPDTRVDFDYTHLESGILELSNIINIYSRDIPVVIISTVLPGTIRRIILPSLSKHVKLCYNPYFIAMGTVAKDCLNPEFILLGNHDETAKNTVINFYKTICGSTVFSTSLENAELIKVSYNTFISSKIAIANTIMELCHFSPNTDCDEVIKALSLATNRIISPAYLRGGMGDGGGCHPRDNIALSWYSKKVNMRYDWFEAIMLARERQTDFLADIIEAQYKLTKLPIIILGTSFKPNTAIKTGSPAILLCNILNERGIHYSSFDPYTDSIPPPTSQVAIYFIACNHSIFSTYSLGDGSILIDPHRSFNNILKLGTYIPVGKCQL